MRFTRGRRPRLQAERAALAHERWDGSRGRPTVGRINDFVAELLSASSIRTQISRAFEGSGYRIGSASVEKVLIRALPGSETGGANVSVVRVPFDALVWFRLERDR